MDHSGFYGDLEFCPCCRRYVRYLRSLKASYCVECGGAVRLFSDADLQRIRAGCTSEFRLPGSFGKGDPADDWRRDRAGVRPPVA